MIIQRQRDQLRETIRHSALHVGDTATVVLGVGANLNDHPNCHVVLHFCSSVMIVLERQVVSAHARRELPSVLAFASCEDERRILDAVLACDDSTNRILVLECKIAVDESAVRIIDVRHCHCNPVAYSDQACVCMVCGKDLCMDAVLRYRAQQVKQKEELVAV